MRDHVILRDGKPPISGSADPAFRSVVDRYNPEDMLLASLSACHMLWFLHLASDAGTIITAYRDEPAARLRIDRSGGGRFTQVTLNPTVTIGDMGAQGGDIAKVNALHEAAHAKCFIANSINFPMNLMPTVHLDGVSN